jgi:copper chaperone NosL
MKQILKIVLGVIVLVVAVIIVLSMVKKDGPIVIVRGNLAQKPLPIKLHKTNDPECAMLIETEKNAAEVVAPDGRTWFFDDPGCMVKWIKDKPFKAKAKLWVHTIDTSRWIDAKKARYGVTDHTAMHYGFGARERDNNHTIDFNEMMLRMYRGENLTNPIIRKKLLGE